MLSVWKYLMCMAVLAIVFLLLLLESLEERNAFNLGEELYAEVIAVNVTRAPQAHGVVMEGGKIRLESTTTDGPSVQQGTAVSCPVLYNMSECLYEVKFQTLQDTGDRQHEGCLVLQGKTVFKWRTSASLVMNDVDQNCTLVSSKMFWNESDERNVIREMDNYLDTIPARHLMIGVLYADFDLFGEKLRKLGNYERHFSGSAVRTPRNMAFQFSKGYRGHSKSVLHPRPSDARSLKGKFYFGHDFEVSTTELNDTDLAARHPEIQNGGMWKPDVCEARWRVAVIIPMLNREQHLRILLDNLFRFLQKLFIAFRIFVVEQKGDALFNRAKLLNIGYREAQKFAEFDCYVFHDVDQIPEDLSNSYACSQQPRKLVVTRSMYDYRVRYSAYFGGVFSMRKEHMELINGFPNRYFGWGGEDDEIRLRLIKKNVDIVGYPPEIARYTCLAHGKEERNPHVRRSIRAINKFVGIFMKLDGLNSLKYDLISVEERPLFTHVAVTFPGPKSLREMKSIYDLRMNLTTTISS